MVVILGVPTDKKTMMYSVVKDANAFAANLRESAQLGKEPDKTVALNLPAGLVSAPLTDGTSEPSGDKAADETLGSLFSPVDI